MPSASTTEDIVNRFKHHPPITEGRVLAHDLVRTKFTELALLIEDTLPNSREKSMAHTTLQNAGMWSNAALAIHEDARTAF